MVNVLGNLWSDFATSTQVAVCPWCRRKEALGTISCYSCGTIMTNSPMSSSQINAAGQAWVDELSNSLGLMIKPAEERDVPSYRGPRSRLPKTWEARCTEHLRGSTKKKVQMVVTCTSPSKIGT